jgi:signal transduction histidine kinase/GAF domain-containing protein
MTDAILAYVNPPAPVRERRLRAFSSWLIPSLIIALLFSVIVPAFEMRRVLGLLNGMKDMIEPSREVFSVLEQVAAHERQSLFINAVLVVVSLAAIAAGAAVSGRERRLAAILQRRVDEESAMANMARTLSEAVALDEAIEGILEGATATTRSIGAYLEIAEAHPYRSAVLLCGHQVLHLDDVDRLPVPLTRVLRSQNEPGVPYEINAIDWLLPRAVMTEDIDRAGLVVPLLLAGEIFGVLVILRDARTESFAENERSQMRLVGDLAAAVIRRMEVERRALSEMQQRATSEAALRKAAEALAGLFSISEVAEQVARSALDATGARGTFVENIVTASDGSAALIVRGAAGIDIPMPGSTRAYSGSFTERAMQNDAPVVTDFATAYPPVPDSQLSEPSSSTAVLPISDANGPVGALFVVGMPSTTLAPAGAGLAHAIAHLATLAYEKVRLIDEAREGRDELERVMKSRERLMRGFSHDVKNPLGAADGYADLLSFGTYGELGEEQQSCVRRIRRSIRRALDLIDDLHELARAESGSLVFRRELVDVGDLVRATGDEYRGAADAAGLPLTVDVADDIPMVETDGGRVRQIVGNLLSNAIKYTRTGAITVRVRRYPAVVIRKTRPWIDIEVTDTGDGIPADKHEQIFEEFSRLDSSGRPGAGLGLAISKRLAEALGGQIIVNSEVGCGSTFTLRVPATSLT